ncbi:hypothetical protein SLE2022_268800 [Rubroshorea leprosula]
MPKPSILFYTDFQCLIVTLNHKSEYSHFFKGIVYLDCLGSREGDVSKGKLPTCHISNLNLNISYWPTGSTENQQENESRSDIHSPPALLPLLSTPVPEINKGNIHSMTPSSSVESPLYNTAPPPSIEEGHVASSSLIPPRLPLPLDTAPSPILIQEHAPSILSSASQMKEPISKSPAGAPAPIASPITNLPQNSPAINATPIPKPSYNSPQSSPYSPQFPISTPQVNSPVNAPAIHSNRTSAFQRSPNQRNDMAPILQPTPPAPTSTPLRSSSLIPSSMPSANQRNVSNNKAPIPEPIAPVASPPTKLESYQPTAHPVAPGNPPSKLPDIIVSPAPTPPQIINWEDHGIPVASPAAETPKPLPHVDHSPEPGSFSADDPSTPKSRRHPYKVPVSSLSSPKPSPSNGHHPPAFSPSTSFHKHQHRRNKLASAAPVYLISPPLGQQGPVTSPEIPRKRQRHHASPPLNPGPSFFPLHVPLSTSRLSPAPSPSPVTPSGQKTKPHVSPKVSPPASQTSKMPLLPPMPFFPPPPPNEDCSTTVCTQPYTNKLPGSPCGCVLPIQVGLSLSVALYTFFPLVSELAVEIAVGIFMKQSQVRIMGANAASEQPEKTVVLVDLVPLGQKFDNTTAFLTYQRFWHKQVAMDPSFFGDYEVLYVRYPGLPVSPPLPPSSIGMIDDGPFSANDNNARAIKPLGVDVGSKPSKNGLNSGMIAIIILSASVAVVLCFAFVWVFLLKHRDNAGQQAPTPRPSLPTLAKPSGSVRSRVGSGLSSASLSFGSSIVAYAGSAKTFSVSDMEKATDNFDTAKILGEGGFGRVYSGVLEDGTKVAVKVLKRDDQQGGREFLAEVEMLSRLHHRNLVKLIGICTEERIRCLVYELIPNGSVESHLHGTDKDSAPLDWDARIKIALGAARGLAYLHEDSSPRVIHRDFKSSNILLENDFTPKVSDFGLARTAMDEENRHISTRVMGTFGYVAPEYAMTGHLLVKSDVYSYGVVLLELLTGRKPVDMSQPPGQENLVTWARPLLTSKEGLETIIDPSLGSDVPFDSVAKVAAIASMCVQPEVSNRPFMGEVVQALKLVCNECDEAKEVGSRSSSRDELSIDLEAGVNTGSEQLTDLLQSHHSGPTYDSALEIEGGLSVSQLFSTSARFGRQSHRSFKRYFSSSPLGRKQDKRFWQRIERSSRGSMSEHSFMFRFWPRSH